MRLSIGASGECAERCSGALVLVVGCETVNPSGKPRFILVLRKLRFSFFRRRWLVARGLRFTATRRTAHFSVAALPACDL